MYIFFSPRANHDKKTVQKRKKVSRRAEKRSVHIEEN